MNPRPDQIEAVMRRSRCSASQAREVCIWQYRAWRDRIRYWVPAIDDNGYSVRREVDRETFIAFGGKA